MKKLIFLSLILFSCKEKTYKYTIQKEIIVNNKKENAIWYVDDYYFLGDTICYNNSDGTKVKICSPYIVSENKN